MTALLVVLGAAVGAPLRYLVDAAMRARFGDAFPWGTFAVNVAGSGVLGVLAGAAVSGGVMAGLGIGFCGALTTYSTFGHETVALARDGARTTAVAYVGLSVVAGLGAGAAGIALGTLLR